MPAGRLDEVIAAERRQALRALLQHPLLAAAGPLPAEFALVRRHAAWLREWLARNPGWSLHVDSETARLRKTPADLADGTRPAREPKSGQPFSRRRYVLLCLALAALERADRQTALGRLADTIVGLAAGDSELAAAGMSFTLAGHDQRRDLVRVIRLLLHLRVLVHVHGDEQQYLAGRGDVLVARHRTHWRKDAGVPGAETALTEQAIDRLEALRLVRRTGEDGVVPLPALGRYALAAPDGATTGALPWEPAE
jgi:hypothetical protein